MSGKSITIGVRVNHELHDKLKAMATADKRTLSQFCNLILAEYVEKAQKPKTGKKS
jgi:predicted HicB family RNase H-like nuclease